MKIYFVIIELENFTRGQKIQMNEEKKNFAESEEIENSEIVENKKDPDNQANVEETENRTVENLEAVGQIILGEVEKVGGILLADPIAQAEGEYNIEMGKHHQEVNKKLTATDPPEDKEADKEKE